VAERRRPRQTVPGKRRFDVRRLIARWFAALAIVGSVGAVAAAPAAAQEEEDSRLTVVELFQAFSAGDTETLEASDSFFAEVFLLTLDED